MGPATRQSVPPRVLLPWWRRPFARPVEPTAPPLQRIVADLSRLEREAERLLGDPTVLARGQRLMAVRAAFDLVVLDAARALEVPLAVQAVPFTREQRFLATVELTRAGLRW
ncbi:hypothetical protein [Jannaschia sp. R86511]|uniref:hypothetical protein n=1 Tax=Jannaschia sp. R86511 TaxID=3093853 RepID=UPI0036D3A092